MKLQLKTSRLNTILNCFQEESNLKKVVLKCASFLIMLLKSLIVLEQYLVLTTNNT